MALQTSQIQEFARVGAAARLKALQGEVAAIRKAFPGIDKTGNLPLARVKATQVNGAMRKQARKRSGWSAAARKAVGLRMKKYWAARRKAEAR